MIVDAVVTGGAVRIVLALLADFTHVIDAGLTGGTIPILKALTGKCTAAVFATVPGGAIRIVDAVRGRLTHVVHADKTRRTFPVGKTHDLKDALTVDTNPHHAGPRIEAVLVGTAFRLGHT